MLSRQASDRTDEFPGALRGSRVVIGEFAEADITAQYLGWLNDPRVVQFSNQRFQRHDRQSALRYLASFRNTPNMFLTVRRADDLRSIGTMTAYVQPHHGTADVGIMIGETSCWGGGYGQDAWNLLTGWLMGRSWMRKLTAGTLACNVAMVRLMERSGMSLEAVRKSQELVNGHAEDVLYFARFQAP